MKNKEEMEKEEHELIDDLVNYHFKDNENLLAEALIKMDSQYAENLLEELKMQLLMKKGEK